MPKRVKPDLKMVPKKSNNSHIVKIKRDNIITWPDLWAEVYIEADNAVEERMIAEMMMIGGRCRKAKTPAEADIVIFGGGADVDPALYGEHQHAHTSIDPFRDKRDIEVFKECYENGIPMVGICRGAQFGHVMLGGRLYQHVDNHVGDHGMFLDQENKIIQRISSVHHQMVVENKEMKVLGSVHGRSSERYTSPTRRYTGKAKDIEAFYYRDAAFLGVQGHPEYAGYNQFRLQVLTWIKDYLVESPDLSLDGNVRRLNKVIRDNRPKIKIKETT